MFESSSRLINKVALISGTARGMGYSHARAFLDQGASVILFDLKNSMEQTLLDDFGDDRVLVCEGDVRSEEDWNRIVKTGTDKFGCINVLVNNAGICPMHRLDTVSEEEYRRVIDINQVGTFLGMKATVPVMKNAGGSIINISSNAGLVGFEDIFAYVASKWAVRGMTKAAALELARYNIRVNAVCPGDTDTPMIRAITSAGSDAAPNAEDLPFKRWAKPEEVSAAVLFLASDESSYMSGTELVVDGAFTAQ